MVPRHKILKNNKKPSKLLMSFALIIAIALPYILVTHFSHNSTDVQDKPSKIPFIEFTTINGKKINSEVNKAVAIQTPKLDNKPIVQAAIVTAKQVMQQKPPVAVIKDNVWQMVYPRSGDSMASIFHRLGLTPQNLQAILYKNPYTKVLRAIKPSQKLEFLIAKNKLEKLIIPINDIQTLTIVRQGTIYKAQIDTKKTTSQNQYASGIIKGSLYTTAARLNIPPKLVSQMAQILNKQVNFSRTMRAGDRISLVYESLYIKDKRVGTGDIVAVTYTTRGKTYQAIRHISANGSRDYYSANGESFKKAFSRYPLRFSHIGSTFSLSRYHPILHYRRAHKGVDLAAPIGTPIQSIGDGTITTIGRHNGYGNMIEIKHDSKYSTIYGHMLKFQKGLSRGSRVRRGQVIGYVGQTGLATGPHCHFEIHVNKQPRNPTTVSIPTAPSIPAREMAAFKMKSREVFARLKQFEQIG